MFLCRFQFQLISIHALREEGDRFHSGTLTAYRNFYPRPPRGGRPPSKRAGIERGRFLSTPSARRATITSAKNNVIIQISIHALREEGDWALLLSTSGQSNFYPRPPRGGRPRAVCRRPTPSIYFYPRPPRGGRPMSRNMATYSATISIHALREEGDTPSGHRCAAHFDFYPRPPRGGRRIFWGDNRRQKYFYPRPPRGGRPAR